MKPLFTPEAMRAVDAEAMRLGYPSLLLMEAAGRAVAEVAHARFAKARIAVLAGKGNNGGDGFSAARWLTHMGHEVLVFAAEDQRGDAAVMRQAAEVTGLLILPLFEAEEMLGEFDLWIDALFGTGLSRPLEGGYAALVRALNAAGRPVVAVDLPSGVPFDPHVRATLTVALGGLKIPHLFAPGRDAAGELVLAEIGLPPKAYAVAQGLPQVPEPENARALVPKRPSNAHKGSVGRVLIAGGYATYTGAPALAALGAYRAGAGLVTLAHPEQVAVPAPVEAVRRPVAAWQAEALQGVKAEAAAVGMGAGPEGPAAAHAVRALGLPTVLDADALHDEVVRAYTDAGLPAVLTPHPGEAARLLETTPEAVAKDPLEAAKALYWRYKQTVVLKGGPTVIASEEGVIVNPTGNPAMATGGMGDVLSGVIAALLAAGLSPFEAAWLGVYLHGLAGDRVGRIGLLASDVANALPEAREALCEGRVAPFWSVYPG